MKNFSGRIILLRSIIFFLLGTNSIYAQISSADNLRLNNLMKKMTLNEMIGQMNQYNGDWAYTGPITNDGDKLTQIKNGQLGSMLNVTGVKHTRQLQEIAMQSRLKIPLLFGQDVIHGFKTTFPIPLAEACSWDLTAIEQSARIAATEAAASGIHWTFAPMVDISRDPRWGRVMEGAGEDPYLGSLIAKARVKGFQGKGLGNTDAVMACAKHFAAYGAAVGGRDYNSVDMSERMLWETYLPPFKAAVDAGAATIMNSFNDLNGVPATGNAYLQRAVLKGKWNFKGFVVSDWGSIGEMINHGFVKNSYEAALSALTAGCDMDMESRSYKNNLAQLVKDKKVPVSLINDAVRRILSKKFEMGLFDDPYRFCNEEREKLVLSNPEFSNAAREMAKKSIVLLKNDRNILPISKNVKTVAVIGPIAKLVKENLGFWSIEWDNDTSWIVSQWKGLQNKLSANTNLLYAKGCGIEDSSKTGFSEAVEIASKADIVIMSVGERRDMSGEAKSRSNIHLPGVQEDLIKAIAATGKPIVVVINAGRPLIFNWTADHVPAILYSWWLGSEAGNALADVLFGDYNPSAKLPISFPRTEGQIPIYYNHYNTGRPNHGDSDLNYVSAYIDLPNSPRFPFGYGLSYTDFLYSDIVLGKKTIRPDEKLTVKLTVTNKGNMDGEEVIQMYIRDEVASVVRPVKELKGFQKIYFKKGESKEVRFSISSKDLQFYNTDLKYIFEPGEFKVFVGGNSVDVKEASFILQK